MDKYCLGKGLLYFCSPACSYITGMYLHCYTVFIYMSVSVIGLVVIFRCTMLSALFLKSFLCFFVEAIEFRMHTLNRMDVSIEKIE